jgi:hypothetical protein
MALLDACVPKALSATNGLIEDVGTAAAPAAVELAHNARATSAPPNLVIGPLYKIAPYLHAI